MAGRIVVAESGAYEESSAAGIDKRWGVLRPGWEVTNDSESEKSIAHRWKAGKKPGCYRAVARDPRLKPVSIINTAFSSLKAAAPSDLPDSGVPAEAPECVLKRP